MAVWGPIYLSFPLDLDMRLIQAMVPPGCLEAVIGTLDEQDVDYLATNERGTDEYEAVM